MEDKAVIIGSSTLSLIASIFIIITFILFEESRRCGRRILLCLSISDALSSIAYIQSSYDDDVPNSNDTPLSCIGAGYLLQFSRLSSYLWTLCFAYHLYQILARQNPTPEMYEAKYHTLAWGLPTLSLVFFCTQEINGYDLIGYSGGTPWCWIRSVSGNKPSIDGRILQWSTFYIPVALILFLNLYFYITTLHQLSHNLSHRMEDKIKRRIILYVLSFILSVGFEISGRALDLTLESPTFPDGLLLLTSVFTPLQGFLNAVVYGCNETMWFRYTNFLYRKKQKPLLY